MAVTPSHVVAGPPGSGATTAHWSDERLREGWDRLEFTAAATRVRILTFWAGTGALRRRTCCTCAWPPGGKIGPSLCLYGRASIIPAPTWREDGSADPGFETYHLGVALFIFSPGHAEALHSDRIWTPERYRPMTWVNRTPQQCERLRCTRVVRSMGVRGRMGRLDRRPPRERPGLTIGNGMGGIPQGVRASGHRAASRPNVRPTSKPRVLGNPSPLQTCALWLVRATNRL